MSLIFDLILSKFSKTFLELITYFFFVSKELPSLVISAIGILWIS